MSKHSQKVAAIAYDPNNDKAPRLVGKASGALAEKVIALAKANGVPIHEDPGLVNFLMKIDLDDKIAPELYAAVASILAMVYSLQGEDGAAHPN